MARESQGLQIALIVFVIFTIILGVTTFIFSKEYSKAKSLAADAEAKAAEANGALSATQSENNRLKVVVGHTEIATLAEVDEAFNKDMETFAKDYNNANQSYRAVCQWLFDEVQRKNASLSNEKQHVAQVEAQNEFLEAAKEKQIERLEAEAKAALARADDQQAKFNTAQTQLKTTSGQLQQKYDGLYATSRDVRNKDQQKIAEKIKIIEGKDKVIGTLYKKIDDMDPIVVDHPDGLVTYAGRGDKVSINLGRADGLSLLTTFAVYERDMTDINSDGRKGAIEVTDLQDHSAVATIVEESVNNPILAGDKIFTSLWNPGQREHFALTCGMDLDEDGRSDVDEIRNLIASSGGVVDFWLDDTGKQWGKMTDDTRHLVIGDKPTDGSTAARLNARTWILDEAKRINLRKISLEELLNRMGYRRKVHVIRYDAQSNPIDFRAQPPEGVPKVSDGRVSDLFEKRSPPGAKIDSAY